MSDIEQKMIFMTAVTGDGLPLIIFAIPRAAWVRMKDGLTSEFDFTKIGIPVRMTCFGCKDHADGMRMVEEMAAKASVTIKDERRMDMRHVLPGGKP